MFQKSSVLFFSFKFCILLISTTLFVLPLKAQVADESDFEIEQEGLMIDEAEAEAVRSKKEAEKAEAISKQKTEQLYKLKAERERVFTSTRARIKITEQERKKAEYKTELTNAEISKLETDILKMKSEQEISENLLKEKSEALKSLELKLTNTKLEKSELLRQLNNVKQEIADTESGLKNVDQAIIKDQEQLRLLSISVDDLLIKSSQLLKNLDDKNSDHLAIEIERKSIAKKYNKLRKSLLNIKKRLDLKAKKTKS